MLLSLLVAISALVSGSVSAAKQNVAGVAIEYGPAFQENPSKAADWQQRMPASARRSILSFEVFEARNTNDLSEAHLVKVRYAASVIASLDGAAKQALSNVVNLPENKNVWHATSTTHVSGRDARRVSFESDRYGGKLGAEFLLVVDLKSNTIYQVQLLFAKRKPKNPLTPVNLEEEREKANYILSTVNLF